VAKGRFHEGEEVGDHLPQGGEEEAGRPVEALEPGGVEKGRVVEVADRVAQGVAVGGLFLPHHQSHPHLLAKGHRHPVPEPRPLAVGREV